MDVRQEIAKLAQISVGNLSKVKKLIELAHPKLLDALRCGDISINKAGAWAEMAHSEQWNALFKHLTHRGIRKTSRDLIRKHQQRIMPQPLDWRQFVADLSSLVAQDSQSLSLAVIDGTGKGIFLTKELAEALKKFGTKEIQYAAEFC